MERSWFYRESSMELSMGDRSKDEEDEEFLYTIRYALLRT